MRKAMRVVLRNKFGCELDSKRINVSEHNYAEITAEVVEFVRGNSLAMGDTITIVDNDGGS